MSSDAYVHVLVATIAGGFLGPLVLWNRKRSQVAGRSRLRGWIVSIAGTAAAGCALMAFTRAFHGDAPWYAATVMILITSWVAVLHSALQLPMPRPMLRVRPAELRRLRVPWTGVRWFGALLRRTPLRHLGGRVYLSEVGRDPRAVLEGIRAAETVHLWALLCSCPWLVLWAAQGRWVAWVCGFAVHVPLNIYPLLHLRYVTGRLEGYAARAHAAAKPLSRNDATETTEGHRWAEVLRARATTRWSEGRDGAD